MIPTRAFWALAFILVAIPVWSQELNIFANGDIADADKINQNFDQLDRRLDAVEADTVGKVFQENPWGGAGWDTVTFDCSIDPNALSTGWAQIGQSRDRVHVKVVGTCIANSLLYDIYSQLVFLDGGASDGSVDSCDSIAKLKWPEDAPVTGISVNNMGTLLVACMEFEALNSPTLRAFGGSYIRTDAGVSATFNNLGVNLRTAIFRSVYQTQLNSMSLESGSTAELTLVNDSEPFMFNSLRLTGSSQFVCRVCGIAPPDGNFSGTWLGGTIGSIDLSGESSVHFSPITQGSVEVTNLTAKHGSMIVYEPESPCNTLTITNSSIELNSHVYSNAAAEECSL